MKTTFYRCIAGAFIASLLAQGSFAQEVAKVDTLPVIVITAKSVVSQKVSDAFKKDFKGAVNPRWYRLDENYLVKFMTREQKNHVLYHKTGSIYYHIAYGTEASLPQEVKDKIKAQYRDGKITTAIHINQDQRSIWLVNIERGKLLILVREEDGDFREVERLKNGAKG